MTVKNYECMFLLNSSRYAQDPTGTETTVKDLLTRCEADVVATAPFQDGKLAYEIEGHRKGLHYLTYFRMDGEKVDELARLVKLNDLFLRHLILEHPDRLFAPMAEALAQHGQVNPPDASEEEEEEEEEET